MMPPPKNKTHCSGTSPQDVLGNLPENVLDVILMCLPLRDAVRTSILSMKWRYKWCRLPQLTIDQTLTKGDLPYLTSNFTKIVYQCILTLHVGPITKFTLDISSLNDCPNIDNLICFLARNDVQHLVLSLPHRGNQYKLPSSFFRCLQLRHLILRNCLLVPPLSFKGFNRLIFLELRRVTISSEILKSLISQCPMLEQLLLDCISCDVIHISAPMLRSFHFEGAIRSISLKKLTLLAKLSLDYVRYVGATGKCNISKLFESFSALEHLYLDNSSLKFFAAGTSEILIRLPFNLNCVKHLFLSRIVLGDVVAILSALCLIRSFPYLQYIEIKVGDTFDAIPTALKSLEVERGFSVSLNYLREVKLLHCIGSKPEMQLMKLLLAKSPVLMRMQIELRLKEDKFESNSKALELCTVINSFTRASPKAKVVFDVIGFR